MKLLTVGNTKTLKGEAAGYKTFILHLAPASLSGYNTCPAASSGCMAACLNTAGRGRFTRTQEARIRRTKMFFEHRDAFMATLVKDIADGIRMAKREGLIPVFRLNGTSDIRWETVPVFTSVTYKGVTTIYNAPNVMIAFPDIQFYDYTKLTNRRNIPANYHLTFSRSESNEDQIQLMALAGLLSMNVAVVFNVKPKDQLPKTYLSLPVVSGDNTDLRFLDPCGSVIGLTAKGLGKKDMSGFVVRV